jgi:thiol:disulfide interchange protein DsbA
VVVDGKYIVEPKRSYDEMLQIVDYLIELQRPNS